MIHLIFSIHDSKAGAYLTPFYLPTIDMASRAFGDCVNSDSHAFGKHPADYTLIQTGQWDDNSNKHDMLDLPNSLGSGIEYLILAQPPEQSNGQTEPQEIEIHNESPIFKGAKS